jgi:hypothetical protein
MYLICFVQPLPAEEYTKIEFDDATIGMNIPKNFIPSIEKVREFSRRIVSSELYIYIIISYTGTVCSRKCS